VTLAAVTRLEHTPAFVTEIDHHIAILRLDRLQQRNSLSVAALEELRETVAHLLAGGDIRSIVFTGTGDVFAAGADLSELEKLDPEAALKFAQLGQGTFQLIANAGVVSVAAINGYCLGGGLDLALSCNLRVASKSAIFAHPGAKRGIITGWGGTQRLPRLVGRSNALQMFLTARMVSSDEALRMGLVSHVGDPVVDLARSLSRAAAPKG
jgi:enoyl-CoA hydratase